MVTGKGGVGKSTVTATLGRYLSGLGRRVLLLEVDPRENLHPLLDAPPSDGEVLDVGGGLYLQNLKPTEVMDWLVRKQVRMDLLVRRIKKSPVYQRFAEGAPGVREMAILGHALRAVEGELAGSPTFDTVILDAPATGHGIYLMTAARLFAEAIPSGPFHALARRVDSFVSDPARSALVVATLAEAMPVQEALELRTGLLERFGNAPELLVINALYPQVPGGTEPREEDDPLLRLWRRRRRVNEMELGRLEAQWQGPSLELPFLTVEQSAGLITELMARFEQVRQAAPEVGS